MTLGINDQLADCHKIYWGNSRIVNRLSVPGAFLIITSLVVATAALLCLALPGINVISSVILPGVLPGLAGFSLGVILLVIASKYKEPMKTKLQEWVQLLKQEYEKNSTEDALLDLASVSWDEDSKGVSVEKSWQRKDFLLSQLLKLYDKVNDKKLYKTIEKAKKALNKNL